MINEARFRKQLSLARTEMEMPDSVCLENEKRLQIADELNKQIVNIKE